MPGFYSQPCPGALCQLSHLLSLGTVLRHSFLYASSTVISEGFVHIVGALALRQFDILIISRLIQVTLKFLFLDLVQQLKAVPFSIRRKYLLFASSVFFQMATWLGPGFPPPPGCAICSFILVMSLPLDTSCSVFCPQQPAAAKQRRPMAAVVGMRTVACLSIAVSIQEANQQAITFRLL